MNIMNFISHDLKLGDFFLNESGGIVSLMWLLILQNQKIQLGIFSNCVRIRELICMKIGMYIRKNF